MESKTSFSNNKTPFPQKRKGVGKNNYITVRKVKKIPEQPLHF